jgi:hypothetical protein
MGGANNTANEYGDPPSWPRHPNAFTLFRATFIHELIHFYDLMILPLKGEVPISSRPEFLNIAGFPERGFLYASRKAVNHLTSDNGSPDIYEWEAPDEAIAVNMEYFLLDENYHCRRPSLDRYFRKAFNLPQFKHTPCRNQNEVLLSYTEQRLPSRRWEKWDFDRLYQVHYLYAGSGSEGSSKFGHAMLRFVFCSPSRKQVGPDCMNDLLSHRVISFRAAVDQPGLDVWKGLIGEYPSILFILPFLDVHRDYTYREMRELFSLPLNLTTLEKRRLFERVIEMHWSYQGQYKFLSDNCAHETMNLLQSALIERTSLTNDSVIRPDSLYGDLIDLKIATGFHLDQDRKLFPQSQYYPSQRNLFEESLSVLSKKAMIPTNMELDAFVESSTGFRLELINKISSIKDPKFRTQMLMGLLNVQQLIYDKVFKEIMEKEFTPYAEELSNQSKNPSGQELKKLIQFMSDSTIPWKMRILKNEYGIPQFSSQSSDQLKAQDALFMKKAKLYEAVWKTFLQKLSSDLKAKLETEKQLLNRIYFLLNH